ncbi:MAG: hypothetical protein M3R27_03050 [Bacteroidota bacterium]|nr:hypothetical protein [Bacteroidota bacterium]
MNKKNILSITVVVVAAVIAFNTSAVAQVKYFKGYVLLLNGDTLKGELKKNMKKEFDNFARASFRKSEGAEMKTYRADKIKEYAVDGVVFVSRNVEGEQVFVKRVSKGAVTLYESQIEVLKMNDIVVKSDYYMEKEAGEFIKIKSGKFKKQMTDVMGDNEQIVKGLEEKKYDYENIVEVFKEYNKSASN